VFVHRFTDVNEVGLMDAIALSPVIIEMLDNGNVNLTMSRGVWEDLLKREPTSIDTSRNFGRGSSDRLGESIVILPKLKYLMRWFKVRKRIKREEIIKDVVV